MGWSVHPNVRCRVSLAFESNQRPWLRIMRSGCHDSIFEPPIKLTKKDSGEGSHEGHHHFIDNGLIVRVEGDKVRLSANGDVAVTMEE